VKARDVNRRIERLGGTMTRQRGSHRQYEATTTLDDGTRVTARTTVAQHAGDIPIGTLRAIEKGHGTHLWARVVKVTEQTYRVVVTREDDAWLADVPDLPGTHTWAKNLPGLDRSVREAIALVENLPDGAEPGLSLAYSYDIGDPELNAVTAHLRAERERIQREERQLAEQTAAVAAQLTERSMSVRDAAALLAVSPQRISQVAPRPIKNKTPPADHPTKGRRKAGRAA
jgi:predicted RNA binding protein YcfA (HicA-like mRNA interferase family)/predicted RNase H-like HicB family nuclease